MTRKEIYGHDHPLAPNHLGEFEEATEHGSRWLTCIACGAQWAIVETSRGDALEQVTDGDDYCHLAIAWDYCVAKLRDEFETLRQLENDLRDELARIAESKQRLLRAWRSGRVADLGGILGHDEQDILAEYGGWEKEAP